MKRSFSSEKETGETELSQRLGEKPTGRKCAEGRKGGHESRRGVRGEKTLKPSDLCPKI